MPRLQNKVQHCITIKTTEMVNDGNTRKAIKQRELVNTECLIIKMCFKFLFETGAVCDHLKFTWETVPL